MQPSAYMPLKRKCLVFIASTKVTVKTVCAECPFAIDQNKEMHLKWQQDRACVKASAITHRPTDTKSRDHFKMIVSFSDCKYVFR